MTGMAFCFLFGSTGKNIASTQKTGMIRIFYSGRTQGWVTEPQGALVQVEFVFIFRAE